MKPASLLLFIFLLPWVAGCGRDFPPPEEQIRTLVAEAREAAQGRDLSALRELVADDYRDDRGRDKADLVNILRLLFLRHQSVHLLTHVSEVTLAEPGRGSVTVYVAMAGRPFPERDVGLVRADMHRFDVTLRDAGRGRWQAVAVDWRRPDRSDWPF